MALGPEFAKAHTPLRSCLPRRRTTCSQVFRARPADPLTGSFCSTAFRGSDRTVRSRLHPDQRSPMATLDAVDFAVHLPDARTELDQDEEWCEVEIDGKRRRIRFHDYASIYDVPGLYERLFAEQLECDSPRIGTDLLGEALRGAKR